MRGRIFVLAGLAWAVLSCETCGIGKEPTLRLYFPSSLNNTINRIVALGANRELPLVVVATNTYQLPVNLNANFTTYVFSQPNRIDTLTVFYAKKEYNVSTRCGYILDLVEPNTSPKFKTTFKEAQIQYSGYYAKTSGLYSIGGEGIIVFINKL